jgi:hypothetical protein
VFVAHGQKKQRLKGGRGKTNNEEHRQTIAAFLIKSALGAINSTNFKAFPMFAASKSFSRFFLAFM